MTRKFNINSRTVTAPLAAFTMAIVLLAYTRQSIHAAKINAKKHREADGGQISWHNESLRRHGVLERPDHQDMSSMKGLFISKDDKDAKAKAESLAKQQGTDTSHIGHTEADRLIRERAGR